MRIFSSGYDVEAVIPSSIKHRSATNTSSYASNPSYRSNIGGTLMPRQPLKKESLTLIKTGISGDDVGGFTEGVGQGLGFTLSVVGLAMGYSFLKHKKFIKGRLI